MKKYILLLLPILSFGQVTKMDKFEVLTEWPVLDFPSTPAKETSDLTFNILGVDTGDTIYLIRPESKNLDAGTYFTFWVSNVNTITVRFHNYSNREIDLVKMRFVIKSMVKPNDYFSEVRGMHNHK